MTGFVLDSSALLAVINDEPGAERVVATLDDAVVSAVNHAEVVTKLVEFGLGPGLARRALLRMGVRVVDFGIDLADRTGELRARTRELGLSLGDRACLALAQRERRVAVTADHKWGAVDIGVDVQLIR